MPTREQLALNRLRTEIGESADPKLLAKITEERKRNEKAASVILKSRTLDMIEQSVKLSQEELRLNRIQAERIIQEAREERARMVEATKTMIEDLNNKALVDWQAKHDLLLTLGRELEEKARDLQAEQEAITVRMTALVKKEGEIDAKGRKAVSDQEAKAQAHAEEKAAFKEEVKETRRLIGLEVEDLHKKYVEFKKLEDSIPGLTALKQQAELLMQEAEGRMKEASAAKGAVEASARKAEARYQEANSRFMAAQTKEGEIRPALEALERREAALIKRENALTVKENALEVKAAQLAAKYGG